MKKRMIDGGMWSNERFAELPPIARLLQIGLISMADDQGRAKAHPAYLRSQIFPYDDVSLDDVQIWLQSIVDNGTALVYESDGKTYVQLLKWWDYQSLQFAMPSDYPRPDGWQDRIRFNGKGQVMMTCNWTNASGEKLPDLCDEDGHPLPIVDDLPPRNQGGRPRKKVGTFPDEKVSGNVEAKEGRNANKEYDYDQVKEDRARVPNPEDGLPKHPSFSEKQKADAFMAQAKELGIDARTFTRITDSVLDATGKRALADVEDDDRWLNRAKQTTIILARMGYASTECLESVLQSWRDNDWRGKSAPTFDQLQEHASAMKAGTVQPKVNPNLYDPGEMSASDMYRESQARLPDYMRYDN